MCFVDARLLSAYHSHFYEYGNLLSSTLQGRLKAFGLVLHRKSDRQMANTSTARKRFLSVCTSFSDEEEIAGLCENACGPDAASPEQQHPYEAMLW